MKRKILLKFTICFTLFGIFLQTKSIAFTPHPDHVVVVIMENTSYSEVIGSSAAPYINALVNDPQSALFTQSFGMSRPSQPNYLQLFSGSAQGVTTNNLPAGIPFTTPNLGAQLLNASKTFMGYSESMPSVGYTGETSGSYARKHNPWVNWQGNSSNGIPSSHNETYNAFPNSISYNSLPSLAIVVPNQDNDMHNGSGSTRITNGDTWLKNNMDPYIQWAKSHNSLFILTFDEDDYTDQHITTVFTGPMVKHGSYSNHIDHYNMLGLLEDMFNLPRIAGAISATPIDYCWLSCYQMSYITATGPTTFCQGNSVNLTASGGNSFLWSNGETTQTINVNASGNFTVTINDGNGCTSISPKESVTVNSFANTANVFFETMGLVSATTSIASHESANAFDNDNLTMTGTGDMRNSSLSTGYPNASAGANVFLTNTAGKYFQIENINTSSYSNLRLSFGVFKSTTNGNGSDLLVQYSTDGTNFSNLSMELLPIGTGTAKWYFTEVSGTIPQANNLRIRFTQNGIVTQYRIDDIYLQYSIINPQIVAGGPVSFCQGGSVNLSATQASAYNWSNGATTQNISVSTGGNYFVTETGINGCTATTNAIQVNVNSAPLVSAFNPSTAAPGTLISITGNNFTGSTSVKFNGTPSVYTVINNNMIQAYVPTGSTSGIISVTNACGSANSLLTFNVVTTQAVLHLKIFVEGFYIGSGQMTSLLGGSECDSITVELRDKNSPYNILYIYKEIINTTGEGTFIFPSSVKGIQYYIAVYGRNSLRTWSRIPVLMTDNTVYDFTNSVTAAYGDNLQQTFDGAAWSLFSGDLNGDGSIDGVDFLILDAQVRSGNGGYLTGDLNGDYSTDGSDFLIIDPHVQGGIGSIRP
jgi:hypothetical protein